MALVESGKTRRLPSCQWHGDCARTSGNGHTFTGESSRAIYARISAAENRPNRESHAERLVEYCAAKGYQAHQAHQAVKESGPGVNDSRATFLRVLADPTIKVVVVEHNDRATRFGFRYSEMLLEHQG